jgi:hypothetical protein
MLGSQVPRTPIDQMAGSLGNELVPLGRGFHYYSAVQLPEEDLREFLHEPIGALPPKVCEVIAPIRVVLVPYLSRAAGGPTPSVVSEEPVEGDRLRSAYFVVDSPTLFFAVKGETSPNYHQTFFNTIAHLLGRNVGKEVQAQYHDLLLKELTEHVHGEVDEASWELKQMVPTPANGKAPSAKSRVFRDYAAQSFIDTMTLYMHGICCDIDVESGPRYIPSRWLRKRLESLYGIFPPPAGRPVLPEHLSRR